MHIFIFCEEASNIYTMKCSRPMKVREATAYILQHHTSHFIRQKCYKICSFFFLFKKIYLCAQRLCIVKYGAEEFSAQQQLVAAFVRTCTIFQWPLSAHSAQQQPTHRKIQSSVNQGRTLHKLLFFPFETLFRRTVRI